MARELSPDRVMEEVDRIMSEPWVWGKSDCCMSASRVFEALHGVKLLRLEQDYCSSIKAHKLIKKHGGMVNMMSMLAQKNSLVACKDVPGAIGVSDVHFGPGPNNASVIICIQPGIWAGKSIDSYSIVTNSERSWCVNSS